MFKAVDIHTTNLRLQKAWRGLQRKVQTTIEHMRVFNNTGVAMVRGDIVALDTTGDREVYLADADGAGNRPNKLAVVCEPIPDGGSGIARYQGMTYVRFDTGLAPLVEGVPAFLSNTPGCATNVDPLGPGGASPQLGIIANAQDYSDQNPFAWVIMNRCCRATQVVPN